MVSLKAFMDSMVDICGFAAIGFLTFRKDESGLAAAAPRPFIFLIDK